MRRIFRVAPASIVVIILTHPGWCSTQTPDASGLLTLNMVAYDRAGNAVGDLRANEIELADMGHAQSIVSLEPKRAAPDQPIFILFDLLNSRMSGRELVKNEIADSLRKVESGGQLYLYILSKTAQLVPIRGLQNYEGPPIQAEVPWIKMVGPLLDRALRQLQQFRPIDLEDPDLRLQATMQGLGNLADQLATLPGRKSIVWITHGVPIDNTWYADAYAADISRICFQLVSDKIPVYAVHESDELGIHIDSGSFLEQFTGLTGGIMFGSDRTEEAISQAIKDSRFSYSLSYRPEHLTWDGKFHKLRVKSTRPGIRLRTLQGYYAIPPPPQ